MIIDLLIAFGLIVLLLLIPWLVIEVGVFRTPIPEKLPEAGWRFKESHYDRDTYKWYMRPHSHRGYVELSLDQDFADSIKVSWEWASKNFEHRDYPVRTKK